MTQSPRPKTQTTKQPRSAAILLLLTIADTTWRVFVPTIGGAILGVTLDNLFGKAPLFTITLISLGCAISAVLVAQQLKKVQRT